MDKNKTKEYVAKFPIKSITKYLHQRKIYDTSELKELQASIQTTGQIDPIHVSKDEKGHYTLLAGWRRLQTVKKIGHTEISAFIYTGLTTLDQVDIALVEQVHHADMSDWDIAHFLAYYRKENPDMKLEEIASRVQKSISWVSLKLEVLKDTLPIQKAVEAEKVTEQQARLLRQLPEKLQEETVKAVEGKTVKETREIVNKTKEDNKADVLKLTLQEKQDKLKEIEDAEKELEKVKSDMSKLEGEVKALTVENKEVSGILKTVEEIEKEYLPTQRELNTVRAEITESKKLLPSYSIGDLEKDRSNIDKEIAKVQVEIDKLTAQLKKLRKDKTTKEQDRNLTQSKIGEYTSRQRKIASLETMEKQLTKRFERVTEKVGDKVKDYEKLKAKLDEHERKILDERLEKQKELNNMDKARATLQGKINNRKALETDISKLQQEIDILLDAEKVEPEKVEQV